MLTGEELAVYRRELDAAAERALAKVLQRPREWDVLCRYVLAVRGGGYRATPQMEREVAVILEQYVAERTA